MQGTGNRQNVPWLRLGAGARGLDGSPHGHRPAVRSDPRAELETCRMARALSGAAWDDYHVRQFCREPILAGHGQPGTQSSARVHCVSQINDPVQGTIHGETRLELPSAGLNHLWKNARVSCQRRYRSWRTSQCPPDNSQTRRRTQIGPSRRRIDCRQGQKSGPRQPEEGQAR